MNRLLILFLAGLSLITCSRPIDNGNFVGEWYVLNFEEGKEHWKIDKNNNVLFYDGNNHQTGRYLIKKLIFESESDSLLVVLFFIFFVDLLFRLAL